jgi:uncharacterized damage-inducible protein DinB
MSNRPTSQEYGDWYADYVSRVPEEQAGRLHGTTKWTLKETLGHLCDGERVFSYRAMRIARGDKTPLPGFEQDDFVAAGNFNARDWSRLLEEWSALRQATIALARSLTPEMLQQIGTASEMPMSARALLYVTVGHERRHMELLKQHAR